MVWTALVGKVGDWAAGQFSDMAVLCPASLLVLLLSIAVCGWRRRQKQGQAYYTQEEVGDWGAGDRDTAVLQARTGPPVERRREWII